MFIESTQSNNHQQNLFPVVMENSNFCLYLRPSLWFWVLVLKSDIRVASYLSIFPVMFFLLKQIFLRPRPACCNWFFNDLLSALYLLDKEISGSTYLVWRTLTVVFRFLLLVAGADAADADCSLLLLEKLVDLSRAVYGWNKFRKFSSTRPLVSRPFTAPATAPFLGEPFSGPWDACSLIRRVASSSKFTALSRGAAMFPTKTGRQRGNILT